MRNGNHNLVTIMKADFFLPAPARPRHGLTIGTPSRI